MNKGTLAETDESMFRASTRSPESRRRYPRFTPGDRATGCTHLQLPPAATERKVQSGEDQSKHVHCALWSPREINRACPAAAPSGCGVGKPADTWTGWSRDSGHAQFQLLAERLERSRNAVDARAMTDIGQSRDLLRGRVQPTRQIGGTHPLAHHFIQ